MTCIVGKVYEDGTVMLGADSIGVSGYDYTVRKDKKLFRVGEFIIGCAGCYRTLQLVQYKLQPTVIPEDMDLHEYMVVHFVEELRRVLKDGGIAEVDRNVEQGGWFLVGIRDRLFQIQSDYQVKETTLGADAVGCGQAYALGAMHAGATLPQALEVAENCSCGVKGPFHFLTTEGAVSS